MKPLVDLLSGIRTYDAYWLKEARQPRQVRHASAFLSNDGRNLWSVLANWQGSPLRYRGQFEWVLQEARRAFPGVSGTIEFDRGIPYLFGPEATDSASGLPPERAPDGLFTGLLHLTAIAGAPRARCAGCVLKRGRSIETPLLAD